MLDIPFAYAKIQLKKLSLYKFTQICLMPHPIIKFCNYDQINQLKWPLNYQ